MKNIEVSHIEVHATPGANIGDCIKDAMLLAVSEWKNVKLIHNGKSYKILPTVMFETCIKGEPIIEKEEKYASL